MVGRGEQDSSPSASSARTKCGPSSRNRTVRSPPLAGSATGQHYGTVIIDCATGQPLDLLPGRNAKTLAHWLRKHPSVEIICRDRRGSYADGARTGAPQAVQVADRFHIWQNLGTAVKTCVGQHNASLKPSTGPDSTANISTADPASPTKAMSPIEARIRERHTGVHALHTLGHGIREIARELHIGGTPSAAPPAPKPSNSCWPDDINHGPASSTPTRPTWTNSGPKGARTPST
ncbi:transposase [Streptomyces sp. NPDC012794]|uniref:transposase n=1 Tax=Streptomyces sp. NPDC012794 TaxID=3364850 RepID=UPI00367C18E2